MEVSEASSITGRLVDRDGAAIPGGVIQLSPREWAGFLTKVRPYTAMADDSGTFLVEGLVPGTEYVVAYSLAAIIAGRAGSTTDVGNIPNR